MFDAAIFFGHGQAASIACHPLRVLNHDTAIRFFFASESVFEDCVCLGVYGCTRVGIHICAVLSGMICASFIAPDAYYIMLP